MLKKIYALLTPSMRRTAAALLVLMFIGMALETLGIGLLIPVIAILMQDDIATRYPALATMIVRLGNPTHEALVTMTIGGLVIVYAFKSLFLGFLAWCQTRFAFGVQAELSQRLFSSYLRQPYTFHLQRNSAHLIRNVVQDVSVFTSNVLAGMTLLTEVLVLFGLCALLLAIEPRGTAIVISALGAAAYIFHYFTRGRIQRWGEVRQFFEGLRIQHLQQGLGGVKDVKLLGRESEFLEQYRQPNLRSARSVQLQTTLQQLPRLWLELLAVVGLAILVLSMLATGAAPAAVLPIVGVFAAAAFRLMPSINRVIGAVQTLRYGLPVTDTLYAELRLPTPPAVTKPAAIRPLCAALELRDVSYSYPGAAAPALKDVSLVIGRGETIGIIGTSGAGKTTLVDIMLGLLAPDHGRVLVDGRDIRENLRNWQDQIGYVPQSIFLTDDTLRRNVAFGLPDRAINDEALQQAIRAAQLADFVASLPDGVETVVGERGVRLSGGQRQRIGIARALLHDPHVLVLDEATSALDALTERSVMDAVKALEGHKTIIIVAHRHSTVEHCSRLYRLEQGRIVEEQHVKSSRPRRDSISG